MELRHTPACGACRYAAPIFLKTQSRRTARGRQIREWSSWKSTVPSTRSTSIINSLCPLYSVCPRLSMSEIYTRYSGNVCSSSREVSVPCCTDTFCVHFTHKANANPPNSMGLSPSLEATIYSGWSKNWPVFCGIRPFITVLTWPHRWSVSPAKWIQFTPSHLEINLNIILLSTFRYSIWSLSFGFLDQNFVWVSVVSHVSHLIVLGLIVTNSKYWCHTQYVCVYFCHYLMPQPNVEPVLLLCRDFYKFEVRFPAQT
jgi:hypothetical protein